jgi:hypothetical protein
LLKKLLPALLALSISAPALAATEAILDGIRLVLPEGSGMVLFGSPNATSDDLQAYADDLRRVVPPEEPMILFQSSPLDVDALRIGDFMTLFRLSEPMHRSTVAAWKGVDEATYIDGMARIDVSKLDGTDPGVRAYGFETGLKLAPKVYTVCYTNDKGDACNVNMRWQDRYLLSWTGVKLNETDTKAMREGVVGLIERAIPDEVAKDRRGEATQSPAVSADHRPITEVTLDGVVYAAPAGSILLDSDLRFMKASEAQARADLAKGKYAPDEEVTLFSTSPVTRASREAQVTLQVTWDSNPPQVLSVNKEIPCKDGEIHPDVICRDINEHIATGADSESRAFTVYTGLPFATEATVLCMGDPDDGYCEFAVRRPDRIIMSWSSYRVDTNGPALRKTARKLILKTLPREAARHQGR